MVDENSTFGGFLTDIGEAQQANANALKIPWKLTHMLLGDANGTDPVPDPAQAGLINQRYRAAINQLFIDPANPAILIAELVLPPNVGGWWIRELGLEDEDGNFVAVANCAPSYKPLLAQGSGRNQVVRMHLILSNTANVELKIDPSIVLATRAYVDNEIVEHATSRNHPAATTTDIGFVRKATSAEAKGRSSTIPVVTPAGLGVVLTEHEQATEAHADNQIRISTEVPQASAATTVSEALAGLGDFASDGYQNIAIFDTPGITDWPVPDVLENGLRKAHVTVIGGGAGGGRGSSSQSSGGGGAGGLAIKLIDLSGIESVSISVGSGGAGGASENDGGESGGSSSFGSYCSATGGQSSVQQGGSGGVGAGGDWNSSLGPGAPAAIGHAGIPVAGVGGGPGGKGAHVAGYPGSNAVGPGGGGSGSTEANSGGNGASGIVIVRW